MSTPQQALRTPKLFCGANYPWPLISEFAAGAGITACFVVREKRRAMTKRSKPYLRLVLGDRSGTIEAVVWEDADRWDPFCDEQSAIGVTGQVSTYNEQLQVVIDTIEPLRPEPADLEQLLPAAPRDSQEMALELDALIASVSDSPLRTLLERCLGPGTDSGSAFRSHPAAMRHHHAYVGGLLEHSLSVARICDSLAGHYRRFGQPVDRDLLVTAGLLHDVGKLVELGGPGFNYTTPGRLLGHILIGIGMVAELAREIPGFTAERMLLLQHLIASHQGKPEWESPKVPQMIEGLLLHYADDLDSKMNAAAALLGPVEAGEWTSYDRHLGRSFYLAAGAALTSASDAAETSQPVNLPMDLFGNPPAD